MLNPGPFTESGRVIRIVRAKRTPRGSSKVEEEKISKEIIEHPSEFEERFYVLLIFLVLMNLSDS